MEREREEQSAHEEISYHMIIISFDDNITHGVCLHIPSFLLIVPPLQTYSFKTICFYECSGRLKSV